MFHTWYFSQCKIMFHTLIFLLTCTILQTYTAAATLSSPLSNVTDRFTLLEFKSKVTSDPLRVLSSWNDSSHFCLWQGVTCSPRHQRVTNLVLNLQRLEGTLSPQIGNLSFLRELDIQNNAFHGHIPQEIGRLFRLQLLGLENNSFGGEIPVSISSCANLEHLRLGDNELVGKIPAELGTLSKLSWVFIYFNSLSGDIPSSLGNLSSLEYFSAAGNNFEGSIPETFGKLKKVTYISIGDNKLSGIIPPSIFNISSLEYFHVPVNKFEDHLPSSLFFTLPNLEVINLAVNKFTGPIPVSISNATNLMRLTIPINNFIGKVPSLQNLHKLNWVSISENQLGNGKQGDLDFLLSLVSATSLQLLAINNNNFGGMLPEAIGNFSTQLSIMSLEYNQITGKIPTGIENLSNLEVLYLSENQFSGRIPESIGNLTNLKELFLHGNNFIEDIPYSVGDLTMLNKLTLQGNDLRGVIPTSLGNCQSLILLDLSDNNLSGNIPLQLMNLSSLSIYLNLSHNHFNGSLPIEISNLKSLAGLDVSDNELSGEIPSSLGRCTSLVQIYLMVNLFQGTIPASLSALRAIEVLDLSHNNLSGTIPSFLGKFEFLKKLNLSHNHFKGKIPTEGAFKNASAISVNGNDELCDGIPELNLSTCSVNGSKKKKSFSMIFIMPVVCGILLLCLVAYFITTRLRKKRKEPSSEPQVLTSVLQVSYDNLLKATNKFSSTNLIGVGGFGSVYRGILEHHKTVIAVKVLDLRHRGASRSFLAECEALRNIRHRNLVKILTACASVDFHGNDFKALVYEFMENGSLEEWLHPTVFGTRNLSLLHRLDIAIDAACALDYLHHYCQPPIVHCDLKPSNVLLNREMIGHISDFGLAKILQETTSANQTSSSGIRGTIGYTAPEYGMGGEVSTHGDVYSYGILLLEMFTGKRPTDSMFKDNLNLRTFVKTALPEQTAETADSILFTQFAEAQTSNLEVKDCLISVLGIGVACTSELPRERMSISDVAAELSSIRKNLSVK